MLDLKQQPSIAKWAAEIKWQAGRQAWIERGALVITYRDEMAIENAEARIIADVGHFASIAGIGLHKLHGAQRLERQRIIAVVQL